MFPERRNPATAEDSRKFFSMRNLENIYWTYFFRSVVIARPIHWCLSDWINIMVDRDIAQPVSSIPTSSHVGFVLDKVALGPISSEHLGFPCQFSFYHTHLTSGLDTILVDQLVADVPHGHSPTPPHENKIITNVTTRTWRIKRSVLWKISIYFREVKGICFLQLIKIDSLLATQMLYFR